ncbi:hypothetical protein C0995_014720 [Termitomyces sp. Mi166|nr:hypothetical protein C0995_014720 [Termitomyces sp. Mi166\
MVHSGSLTPGKGKRLVLANTEELHDRIETLSLRIRDLETALQTAHQSVPDQLHPGPLLQKDVLQPIFPHNANPLAVTTSNTTNNSSTASAPLQQPLNHLQPHPTEADEENFIGAFGRHIGNLK